MKIRFEQNDIYVDGEYVGYVTAKGYKVLVELKDEMWQHHVMLCVKDIQGRAQDRAKRWVKAAIKRCGGAANLVDAITRGAKPLEISAIPRQKRTAKVRREEVRLAEWARQYRGYECSFFYGDIYEGENQRRGVLVDIASEGYYVAWIGEEGDPEVIPHRTMQSIFPPTQKAMEEADAAKLAEANAKIEADAKARKQKPTEDPGEGYE